MDDNWDLGAIVRSSTVAAEETKTTTAAAGNENNPGNRLSFLSSIKFEDDDDPFSFPNLLMSRTNGLDELEDSCKPFFSSSSAMSNSPTPGQNAAAAAPAPPPPTVTAATSPVGSINSTFFVNVETTLTAPQQQPYPTLPVEDQVLYPRQQPEIGSSGIFQRSAQQPQPASRSSRKSKKTPPKKLVCHVTAENLSSDLWAWRKYGQKPIKNSPYPRNYYRCSSTKACTARKQVERSKTDPTVFIVSYTGDHNHPRPTHRNSLAGSTRGKYTRNRQNHAGRDDQNNTGSEAVASCSSPLSATSLSPTTPLRARTEGENMNGVDETNADDVLIPNFAAMTNEYIFQKMEELGGRTAIPDRERMRGGGTAAGGGACFGGGGVSF